MPILACQYWWCWSYTPVTATANTADIDTTSNIDTNIDNEVDANDANDANTVYSRVADDGTAGMTHQYTDSEVMGMDALHQRTGCWFEDVLICLNLDLLRYGPFSYRDITTLPCPFGHQ